MPTIAEEEPFSAVVADDKLNVVCSNCFISKANLFICGRCEVIHYCGIVCQQEDWKYHKSECRSLRQSSSSISVGHLGRLVARIAFRLKTNEETTAFNDRCWEDLMDHHENITNDPTRSIEAINLAESVHTFMGPKSSPGIEKLIRIYGKVKTNSFAIIDDNEGTSDVLGEAVYIGLSVHDHSCDPDCFVIFDGKKAVLRTVKNQIYSKELKICYIDLVPFTFDRRLMLKKNYYFDCDCKLCSDPIRNFWGKSAVSTCCSDAVHLNLKPGCFTCTGCGRQSEERADLIAKANKEVLDFLRIKNLNLGDNVYLFNKMKKILSRFNFGLLDLVGRIIGLSMAKGEIQIAREHALFAVDAFRYYLPPGTAFTSALLEISNIITTPITEQEAKFLEQVIKELNFCYGNKYPPIRRLRKAVDEFYK